MHIFKQSEQNKIVLCGVSCIQVPQHRMTAQNKKKKILPLMKIMPLMVYQATKMQTIFQISYKKENERWDIVFLDLSYIVS